MNGWIYDDCFVAARSLCRLLDIRDRPGGAEDRPGNRRPAQKQRRARLGPRNRLHAPVHIPDSLRGLYGQRFSGRRDVRIRSGVSGGIFTPAHARDDHETGGGRRDHNRSRGDPDRFVSAGNGSGRSLSHGSVYLPSRGMRDLSAALAGAAQQRLSGRHHHRGPGRGFGGIHTAVPEGIHQPLRPGPRPAAFRLSNRNRPDLPDEEGGQAAVQSLGPGLDRDLAGLDGRDAVRL